MELNDKRSGLFRRSLILLRVAAANDTMKKQSKQNKTHTNGCDLRFGRRYDIASSDIYDTRTHID